MRCHWGRCCVLVVVYLTDALREKRASTAQHCTAQHRNLGLHTFIVLYLMAACGGMYGGWKVEGGGWRVSGPNQKSTCYVYLSIWG